MEGQKNMIETAQPLSQSLGQLAWKRLRRNKLAMTGVGIILIAVLISLFGSLIRPDKTVNANDQMLQLARKSPGFTAQLLAVTKNKEVEREPFWNRLLLGGKELPAKTYPYFDIQFDYDEVVVEEYTGRNDEIRGREHRFKMADVIWPLAMGEDRYSISGEIVTVKLWDGTTETATLDEMQQRIEKENLHTRTFWLGTDKFGRDLLSRIMGGTIVSLGVGIISVLISLVIGITLGAVSGFFRGWVDEVIMWLINVMWSVPTLLLVMAITLALGKGFTQVYIAVGLTMWVEVARVVRGQVLSLREQEFIEAGRALGFRTPRIIIKHVLPNVMAPVIVISAANFATAILIEAGLSFLGIGAQIPMPSWGQMIKEHYSYITTDLAYLAVLPGICIMVLVLAFMLLGNGLRDALDQKAVG